MSKKFCFESHILVLHDQGQLKLLKVQECNCKFLMQKIMNLKAAAALCSFRDLFDLGWFF